MSAQGLGMEGAPLLTATCLHAQFLIISLEPLDVLYG